MSISITGLLGISIDSSDDDIRKAFRRAILTNHPDRGGEHEKLIQILKAKDAFEAGIFNRPTTVTPDDSAPDLSTPDLRQYYGLRTRWEQALARNGGQPSRGSEYIRKRMEELLGKG